MNNKIKYLICKKDNFFIDDGLKNFSERHNCESAGVFSKIEEVFSVCDKEKINVLFLFNDDLSFETMQNSMQVLKSAFPQMCICLFTNDTSKYLYCDYQFDFNEYNLKIYNILFNYKHSLSNDCEGFYVAPSKVVSLLNILELQKRYKGYEYLKCAIEIVCQNKKDLFGNMSKVYSKLAEKYGVTATSIERCIRLTINESSLYIDPRKFEGTKYYSLSKSMENMCNGEFIRAVVTQLYEDMFA